ncbi:MAG: DUF1190 domain-containing protein [Pseudomonadota bacterium]
MTHILSKPGIAFAACSLALAGCGGGGGPKAAVPEGPKAIFTSSYDCVQSKLFSEDDCRNAIEKAIKSHRAYAPKYKTRRQCEAKEIQCERGLEHQYRPRLVAFLVQPKGGSKPGFGARALYPPTDEELGLRDLSNTVYLGKDINLTFSNQAQRAVIKVVSVERRYSQSDVF